MNIFEQHFKAIQDTYSSLEIFSDISWEEICNEYLASYEEAPKDVDDFVAGFPQFLEDKAAEGECPTYLFEIAYVEFMASVLSDAQVDFPTSKGLHLNPTLSFLTLEFDVLQMLEESKSGEASVIERPHILCLYQDQENGLCSQELEEDDLEILKKLEEQEDCTLDHFASEDQQSLDHLIKTGMILDIP
jgi:hypothetical protein